MAEKPIKNHGKVCEASVQKASMHSGGLCKVIIKDRSMLYITDGLIKYEQTVMTGSLRYRHYCHQNKTEKKHFC